MNDHELKTQQSSNDIANAEPYDNMQSFKATPETEQNPTENKEDKNEVKADSKTKDKLLLLFESLENFLTLVIVFLSKTELEKLNSTDNPYSKNFIKETYRDSNTKSNHSEEKKNESSNLHTPLILAELLVPFYDKINYIYLLQSWMKTLKKMRGREQKHTNNDKQLNQFLEALESIADTLPDLLDDIEDDIEDNSESSFFESLKDYISSMKTPQDTLSTLEKEELETIQGLKVFIKALLQPSAQLRKDFNPASELSFHREVYLQQFFLSFWYITMSEIYNGKVFYKFPTIAAEVKKQPNFSGECARLDHERYNCYNVYPESEPTIKLYKCSYSSYKNDNMLVIKVPYSLPFNNLLKSIVSYLKQKLKFTFQQKSKFKFKSLLETVIDEYHAKKNSIKSNSSLSQNFQTIKLFLNQLTEPVIDFIKSPIEKFLCVDPLLEKKQLSSYRRIFAEATGQNIPKDDNTRRSYEYCILFTVIADRFLSHWNTTAFNAAHKSFTLNKNDYVYSVEVDETHDGQYKGGLKLLIKCGKNMVLPFSIKEHTQMLDRNDLLAILLLALQEKYKPGLFYPKKDDEQRISLAKNLHCITLPKTEQNSDGEKYESANFPLGEDCTFFPIFITQCLIPFFSRINQYTPLKTKPSLPNNSITLFNVNGGNSKKSSINQTSNDNNKETIDALALFILKKLPKKEDRNKLFSTVEKLEYQMNLINEEFTSLLNSKN